MKRLVSVGLMALGLSLPLAAQTPTIDQTPSATQSPAAAQPPVATQPPTPAQPPVAAPRPALTSKPCQALPNGGMQCDAASFRAALARAATARLLDVSRDTVATGQVRRYLTGRGLIIQSEGDLTFELVRSTFVGMDIGINQVVLARLRVYAKDVDGERGPLLWMEPLMGQPDKPWLSQVQELLDQFDDRFKPKKK